MESGKLQLQELFRFVNLGYAQGPDGMKVRGYFTGCDIPPNFYEALRASGHALDLEIFKSDGQPAGSSAPGSGSDPRTDRFARGSDQ